MPRIVQALHLAAGVAVLWALQLLGGWIAGLVHLPVPGAVIGLVLLATAIGAGVLPLALVRPAADLLVRHLSLLYVPAGAALMLYWALVRREWLPIAAGGIAGTIAVLLAAGLVLHRTERAA